MSLDTDTELKKKIEAEIRDNLLVRGLSGFTFDQMMKILNYYVFYLGIQSETKKILHIYITQAYANSLHVFVYKKQNQLLNIHNNA